MTKFPLCALPLLALAGCHADVDLSGDADNGSGSGNVHVAMADNRNGGNKVAISAPGFSANLSLPGLDLGNHIDMDGIHIAPNSKVTGFDAFADDKDDNKGGSAKVAFTNSDAPAALIGYYRKAAADAGYGDIVAGNGSLTARKGDKLFALAVTPQGGGSAGSITMTGK